MYMVLNMYIQDIKSNEFKVDFNVCPNVWRRLALSKARLLVSSAPC